MVEGVGTGPLGWRRRRGGVICGQVCSLPVAVEFRTKGNCWNSLCSRLPLPTWGHMRQRAPSSASPRGAPTFTPQDPKPTILQTPPFLGFQEDPSAQGVWGIGQWSPRAVLMGGGFWRPGLGQGRGEGCYEQGAPREAGLGEVGPP